MVTNVENLDFSVTNGNNQFVRVNLSTGSFTDQNGNPYTTGSAAGDTINLATLYPGMANLNLGASGGGGDDTLIGNAGNNNLDGGFGNDSIDGGAGQDFTSFLLPPGLGGVLRVVQGTGGDAGKLIVERVENNVPEQVFRLTRAPNGVVTVEGLNSAAANGTDTLTNVEFANFAFDGFANPINVRLFVNVNAPDANGGFANGTDFAETLDAAALYPGASHQITLAGGAGNDTLIGHDGANGLDGGQGSDTIDGGAGLDTANFTIAPFTGTLQLVEGSGGDAGNWLVQRVDGQTTELLFRISNFSNGGATVTGVNSASVYGVDTVTNTEYLSFQASSGNSSFVTLQIGLTPNPVVSNSAHVNGTFQNDTINLATLYPGAGTGVFLGASGQAGNDTIIGHAGNNGLNGGDGNDVLTGGLGDDSLIGGAGTDVAVFAGARNLYTLSRQPNGDIIVAGPDGNDTVNGDVETLRFDNMDVATETIGAVIDGTSGNDNLNGTTGADTLNGLDGQDNLHGGAGGDSLNGGAGNDYLHGGGGDDVAVFSGNRNDYTITQLAGGAVSVNGPDGIDYVTNTVDRLYFQGDDVTVVLDGTFGIEASAPGGGGTVNGGAGDDALSGSAAADTLNGGDGNDSLFGNDGNDTLNGGAGNDDMNGWTGDDTLIGGAGNDAMYGEAGNDYARGEEGADRIDGGDGDDILLGGYYGDHVAQPGDGADHVLGGSGNDVLRGGDGNDILEGGDGDDNLRGDLGNDRLDGGGGNDFVSYRYDANGEMGRTYDHGAPINFDASGIDFTSGAEQTIDDLRGGTDTLISIERLGVTGTNYADTIRGGLNAQSNQLTGYGGNDTLIGGNSNDDVAIYTGSFADYDIAQSGGTLTVTDLRGGAPDGTDTLTSIELLTFSDGQARIAPVVGDGTDNLIGGGNEADLLVGNGGDDDLFGNNGNDLINGGAGDDYMNGGAGDDRLHGGAGRDQAAFNLPQGTPGTLRLVEGGNVNEMFVERVDGQTVEQVFRISFGANGVTTVTGIGTGAGVGTDTLTAIEQLDFFIEQPQGQNIPNGQYLGVNLSARFGTVSNNFAFVEGAVLNDNIDLAAAYPAADGTISINVNAGRGDDVVTGHAGQNFLDGGVGNDTLDGAGGNDTLNGGLGNDALTGGDGDDRLQGGAGNDTLNGGTGSSDFAIYTLAGDTPGTLRSVAGPDPDTYIVQRLVNSTPVEDLVKVTVTGMGAAIVEGLGARAAEFGTDTVSNIDELHIYIDTGQFVQEQFVGLRLSPLVPAQANNAFVNGSLAGDTINLATLYPSADGTIQLNANGNEGNDTITGHVGANNLQGGAGNDTLNGGDGNDTLSGQVGDDTINGGNGTDNAQFTLPANTMGTLSFRPGTNAGEFIVQLTNGQTVEDIFLVTHGGGQSATVQGMGRAAFLGTDTVSNIEQLQFFIANANYQGSFVGINLAPVTFPANGNNNASVQGSIGNDSIDISMMGFGQVPVNSNGGFGNDSITGHAGDNTLTGAAGDDMLFGGDGDDILIGGFNSGGAPQPGDGNDTLEGGEGDDVLRGGDGDDLLRGEEGDDNLRGDLGSDILDGGAGRDFVSYRFDDLSDGVVFDAANFGATTSFTHSDGRGGTDQLVNVEALGVTGSQGNDEIYGSMHTQGAEFVGYANQLSGEGGNDQLHGGGSIDLLQGGAGNDQLYGLGDDDDLNGGAGDDYLEGGAGHDTAGYNFSTRTSGVTFDVSALDLGNNVEVTDEFGDTDTLYEIEAFAVDGSSHADTFIGNTGNDEFYGAGGNDIFIGSAGIDRAKYDGSRDDYDVTRLQNGSIQVTDLREGSPDGVDVLTDVEELHFLGEDDEGGLVVIADSVGTAGDDNNPPLFGTSGDDTLYGGTGNDSLVGGDGEDYLAGGAGNDSMQEGDLGVAAGGLGDDLLDGGDGNDVIFDFVGRNEIRGGAGNDLLGGTGAIFGGAGTDSIVFLSAGPSIDYAWGGTGNDIFTVVPAVDPNWVADHIMDFNPTDSDLINVGPIVDRLQNHVAGTDLFAGGYLRLTQAGSHVAVQVNFAATGNTNDFVDLVIVENRLVGAVQGRVILPVSGLANGGSAGNNNLTGTDGNDTMHGFGGTDTIGGGLGNDTITGGAGNDTLNGGSGDDTLNGDGPLELSPGDDLLNGGDGNDRLFGDGGYDRLRGGIGDDLLDGGGGEDDIQGNEGNDTLIGGEGTDLMRGGSGVDSFDGGDHDPLSTRFHEARFGDRISFFEQTATAGVIADLRSGIISNDGFGNSETMVGIESLGGDTRFADIFHGNDADNLLLGSIGDTLNGYDGDDLIQVSGAATVDGGDGHDGLVLANGGYLIADGNADGLADNRAAMTNGWTIDLAAGTMTDGYGDVGTVTGIEEVLGSVLADTLIGSANADILNGGDHNDTLDGGTGDDALTGGAGYDVLTGGDGADRFVLGDEAGGSIELADLITDFELGSDHIEIGGGLTFADLTITDGDVGAVIQNADGDYLGTVLNINAVDLTAQQFQFASGG
ncbi:hypothetical protein ACFOMD_09440 [Sphingoaurantiacus capsulatus]|uniref:Uncharacterized protein n=1 Tax=Sphingoaurantiacus capsulatus TaxID=1771310 RepID=A0ABV7XC20_9SPHN